VWAIGLAVAVSVTTNPLLLALGVAVVTTVVVLRRGDSPWARSFRLYAILGAFVIGVRLVLHVLVGLKFGDHVLLPLPEVRLPSWAAGIDLLGDVRLEGLLAAGLEGARLAAMILAIGAANALANPKRLLRAAPGALLEIGTAVVVAVTVAPQLAQSVQRVLRARTLRGQSGGGLRAVRQVALPVLQDTLDRSLALASAMDSRGYGRATEGGRSRVTPWLSLGGLLAACVGIYGALDTSTPRLLGLPLLALGVLLSIGGLAVGSASVQRTRYRADPWLGAEWLTVGCGVVAAAALLASLSVTPLDMALPLSPIGWPGLPALAAVGLLVGALPAFLTPEPPPAPARDRLRRRPALVEEVNA
jgi:energy-coupling factor transport system permease protein